MFSNIAGQLAQAGRCSVVLQDCWPRLACVQKYCRTAGLGWLVLQDGWPMLACVW